MSAELQGASLAKLRTLFDIRCYAGSNRCRGSWSESAQITAGATMSAARRPPSSKARQSPPKSCIPMHRVDPSHPSLRATSSFSLPRGHHKGRTRRGRTLFPFFCELTFDDLQIFLALPSYPGRDPLSSTNLRQRPPQLARAHAPRTGRRGTGRGAHGEESLIVPSV